MRMAEAKPAYTHRGVVTLGVLHDVGPVPNVPEQVVTGLQRLLDAVSEKEKAAGAVAASLTSLGGIIEDGWKDLWRRMQAVYNIAATTEIPTDARVALSVINTDPSYTVSHARTKAKQTRSALTQFPDTFSALDKTKAEIVAEIDGMFAAELDQDNLRVEFRTSRVALREADKALDKENKRIYRILRVSFPKGSQQWQLIMTIPTCTIPASKRKKKNVATSSVKSE